MTRRAPPLFVLGVRRSGTTLLRLMLDGNAELAVPDESYFIPQLADRHRGRLDREAFVDDLRRLETLADWGVTAEDVAARLGPARTLADALAAVYQAYAARAGKTRWGDKTPMYMQHLSLLERLFPDALFVHLIRDGRDAALSFLAMPAGIVTEGWGYPRTAGDFACQWRTEVAAARRLGRRIGAERYLEVRYEELVAGPERELRRICGFAALEYDPGMLEYAQGVDASAPHQRNLTRPPTRGLRDWRTDMAPGDVAAFERVAGDLLHELGYEPADPGRASVPDVRARLALLRYGALNGAWRGASVALRRSPLWRLRHPVR